MPRGNDPDARKDLVSQYGEGHGNAELLIKAHDDAYDVKLQAALGKRVEQILDPSTISPREGGTVMSAAIRGGLMVVVEEAKDGRYVKWYDDPPKPGSKAAKAAAKGPEQPGGGSTTGGDTEDDGSGSGSTNEDDQTGSGSGNPPAPGNVKVDSIKDALKTLDITPSSDVRRKDDLWALVPEDAKTQLQDEADKADAEAAAQS